ncbi:hypothetical protein C5B42_02045 [Candidatus Cerribacteria bacterium 'Amazon FNV 2010 28 9']|uniref:Glycosyltransferase subfamily 4-like N-terminal domain-containing protein n=1 Tax=Candidatus Cerribacteria bacterium 'Amazon FNV 2010 28 9' TaxID=2081795 RepID=A0A317JTB4_9BACT|nr:MAG: hypothetical protein C5B42_02045 [Candidatus Cerribacteria bacterium 'Amazon FNV 2010 28 9']
MNKSIYPVKYHIMRMSTVFSLVFPKNKRILFLVRLFTPHIGGVETHVSKLTEQALLDGNTVRIITSQYDPILPYKSRFLLAGNPHLPTDNLFIYRIPNVPLNDSKISITQKVYLRIHVWWWMVRHIFLFLRADIVHIHDIFWWYWPIKIIFPWKKVYVTFHGFEVGSMPTQKAKRVRKLITFFSTGTVAIGAWIAKWYGTKSAIVLYGASDCKVSSARKRSSSILSAVFIGRLEDDTGILAYIDAIKKQKNIQLSIYGEGKYKEKIIRETKKSKNIVYEGVTTDVCTALQQADIACVSSYLSIADALALNIPVIAYATDELKKDYLCSHPAHGSFTIVESKNELESVLKNWKISKKKRKVVSAQNWVKKNTWKYIYLQYKKVWGFS